MSDSQTPTTPTVGRIVLFRSNDPSCLSVHSDPYIKEVPAIITRVWNDVCVNLQVFKDGYLATSAGYTSVPYDQDGAYGYQHSWAWPTRS